jgi:transposase
MIKIDFSEKEIDKLYELAMNHPDSFIRKKFLVLYLKARGLSHKQIAAITRVTDDTVTNYLKEYVEGGVERVLQKRFYQPKSQLDPFVEEIKEMFKKHPPHSAKEAAHRIKEKTGIHLSVSACRDFLKKRLGMRVRRVGMVPSKADPDEQEHYVEEKLSPRLEEAKQGKRAVYFVDAAHFVMGAFLGFVWCFFRVFLRASSGRQRYNVLGAFDGVNHNLITVTNETYINRFSVCTLLEKISEYHGATHRPVTVVLDNARYQRAKVVREKALELGIELLFLPAYSPNLNLIERLWRFIKKQCLYNTYYDNFSAFKQAINQCMDELKTTHKKAIESLMTLKFQMFSKSEFMTV